MLIHSLICFGIPQEFSIWCQTYILFELWSLLFDFESFLAGDNKNRNKKRMEVIWLPWPPQLLCTQIRLRKFQCELEIIIFLFHSR